MHASSAYPWTVSLLAKATAQSRSAFFERFRTALGVPPMRYLLDWRMVLSRHMLQQEGRSIAKVAERVGYSSTGSFSAAFTRHIGSPPATFAGRSAVSVTDRAAARRLGPFGLAKRTAPSKPSDRK